MTNLSHDAEQCDLPDVGAFAAHVRTRADLGARMHTTPQVGVIGHKRLLHEGIQDRMAPLANVNLRRLTGVQEAGTHIPAYSADIMTLYPYIRMAL